MALSTTRSRRPPVQFVYLRPSTTSTTRTAVSAPTGGRALPKRLRLSPSLRGARHRARTCVTPPPFSRGRAAIPTPLSPSGRRAPRPNRPRRRRGPRMARGEGPAPAGHPRRAPSGTVMSMVRPSSSVPESRPGPRPRGPVSRCFPRAARPRRATAALAGDRRARSGTGTSITRPSSSSNSIVAPGTAPGGTCTSMVSGVAAGAVCRGTAGGGGGASRRPGDCRLVPARGPRHRHVEGPAVVQLELERRAGHSASAPESLSFRARAAVAAGGGCGGAAYGCGAGGGGGGRRRPAPRQRPPGAGIGARRAAGRALPSRRPRAGRRRGRRRRPGGRRPRARRAARWPAALWSAPRPRGPSPSSCACGARCRRTATPRWAAAATRAAPAARPAVAACSAAHSGREKARLRS